MLIVKSWNVLWIMRVFHLAAPTVPGFHDLQRGQWLMQTWIFDKGFDYLLTHLLLQTLQRPTYLVCMWSLASVVDACGRASHLSMWARSFHTYVFDLLGQQSVHQRYRDRPTRWGLHRRWRDRPLLSPNGHLFINSLSEPRSLQVDQWKIS